MFSPISEGFHCASSSTIPAAKAPTIGASPTSAASHDSKKTEGDRERQQHAARLQRPGMPEQTRHEITPAEDGATRKARL